jgi:hypothetical protein
VRAICEKEIDKDGAKRENAIIGSRRVFDNCIAT